MTPPSVCVVGSANMDLTFLASRLPIPGETLPVLDFHSGCGGKGANQAVMAARLGARVTFVGRVGSDPFGERLVRSLGLEGINASYLTQDPRSPTGLAGIVVDAAGQNRILLVPGANASLTARHVREAAESVRTAAVVVGQLEVPVEATLQAFRLAHAAGVRTLLNPAPAATFPDELLRLTDWCVPNETEAAQLTGLDTDTASGAVEAARSLLDRGPMAVVITLGRRGCLIADSEGNTLMPAASVKAVDSTGAGDAFVGALAAHLASRISIREAAARATVAASLSVTRPGAQSSYPTPSEIAGFLSQTSVSPNCL